MGALLAVCDWTKHKKTEKSNLDLDSEKLDLDSEKLDLRLDLDRNLVKIKSRSIVRQN